MVLAKRIIPCLDVDDGRVVKGVKFIDIKDAGDPVEIAHSYEKQNADELIFLDITASSNNRNTLIHIVEQIASRVFIPLTVGGGIRKLEDIHKLLAAGADKISINTAAIKDPSFIEVAAKHFGSQCIVVAIDAKRTSTQQKRWEIFTHGGRNATGINALEWAVNMQRLGAGEILLTSMDRDGTGEGFDLELTKTISEAVNIPTIASGGVGNPQHLVDGLTKGKADAVLAASIFHFAKYTIPQVKKIMRQHNIEVRI